MFLTQNFLIGKGVTTYEHLKEYYDDIGNPFDEGLGRNCKAFYCGGRRGVSKIRKLEEVST